MIKPIAALIGLTFFIPAATFAQGVCPAIDFLNAREIAVFTGGDYNTPLVRRPDGSFSLYPHARTPPYARGPEQPNAHDFFTGCLPLPFKPVPVAPTVGRRQGEPSVNTAVFPDVGNGLSAGVWINFRGDSVTVYPLDAVYRYTTTTDYPIGDRNGLLPGDFNGDGKPDLAVIGYGPSNNDDGFIAVLLGKGDGTFNQAVKTVTGSFPFSGAAADYNRDGKLDIAVGLRSGLAVMLGKGDGTFQAPESVSTASGLQYVGSADWNNDQRPDLAATAGTGDVLVWLGNGDGTFRAPATVESAVDPVFISSGDFNKDGRNDLAIAGRLAVAVALGNGDGTFGQVRRYLLGHEPRSIVVADVNRDGNLDIVTGEGSDEILLPMNDTGFMGVLFGNGDGTFVGAPVYGAGSSPKDFAVADFTGDGRLDAIAAGSSAAALLIRNANGEFGAPVAIAGGDAVAAGDFTGDGKMDVALGQGPGSQAGVQIFPGNGNGTFRDPTQFPLPTRIARFASGDFNGDGRTDLAAAYGAPFSGNAGSGVLILLQSASGSMAPGVTLAVSGPIGDAIAADLNGDGHVDLAVTDNGVYGQDEAPGGMLVYLGRGDGTFQDAVTLPAGMHPTAATVGDVNGDGRSDVVVTTSGPSFSYALAVFLGRAGGSPGEATFIPTDFGPSSVGIGDFNGDGAQDLIVAHCCGETDMTYMLGRGDGSFDPEAHFSGGADPQRVATADLNSDGRPDVLILNSPSGFASGISVLMNISPQFVAVSAASGNPTAPVAPDSIVSAYGGNLTTGSEVAQTLPLPEILAGISVHLQDSAGTERNAPLYAAFPSQVNFLMPADTALGRAAITIGGAGGAAPQSSYITVARVSPGLFTLNPNGLAAAQIVRVNGSQTATEDVYQVVNGQVVPRPIEFGPPEEQVVLVLYGTGFRHRAALSDVRVVVSDVTPPVAYAGPQNGFEGLDQINVNLNPRLLQGDGLVDVKLTVEGKSANTVKLEFR